MINPERTTALKLLSTVKLFSGFGPADLDRFMANATGRVFVPDERIIAEGEPGHSLYVILSGKVEVSRRSGHHTQALMRLGPGETFGEMSLLLPEKIRTATVKALEPTSALAIDPVRLSAIPELSAAVYRNMALILASRLKLSTDIVVLQAATGLDMPHNETLSPARRNRPSKAPVVHSVG